MKAPTAISYESLTPVTSNATKYDLCEEKANAKMATMRFTSAQARADYEKNFITTCMGISQQPSSTVSSSPTATGTVTNTASTNLTSTPIKTGTSVIVEPDFANVKVYDLDIPSGSPSVSPIKTGTSAIVEPNFANVKVYDLDAPTGGSVPSTSTPTASNEVISEGNGESASSTLSTTQKPNYLLYGGIAISAIILYKILK